MAAKMEGTPRHANHWAGRNLMLVKISMESAHRLPRSRQSTTAPVVYEDAFDMMVRRWGADMPSSGGNRAEIPQKKQTSTDEQTDFTVIWDTKSTKTDFLSDPKSVDRKTKKHDRRR